MLYLLEFEAAWPCDEALHKKRYKIENSFGWIKDWRPITTRYDRRAHAFFSAIRIGCLRLPE